MLNRETVIAKIRKNDRIINELTKESEVCHDDDYDDVMDKLMVARGMSAGLNWVLSQLDGR